LDPSADPNTRETSKMGLDATKPLDDAKAFEKGEWKRINTEEYL